MEMKKTILVVDDDEIICSLLKLSLTEQGFRVLTAENGFAALDTFTRNGSACDLVIVDMSMPGMTGLEVCERLKGIQPLQKVILSTGNYVSEEDIEEFRNYGICHVIRKPFNINDFISFLKNEMG